MTKTGLFFASHIAAIPAAALAYLLVTTFLDGERAREVTGNMFMLIIVGTTLTISVLVALLPEAILIFMRSGKTRDDDGDLLTDDSGSKDDSEFTDDEDVFADDDVFADGDEDEDEDEDEDDDDDDEADLEIEGLDEEDIFAEDDASDIDFDE